jgi:hypothetical protein
MALLCFCDQSSMLCSLKAQKTQFRVQKFEIQQLWVFGVCFMSFVLKNLKTHNLRFKNFEIWSL